MEPTSRDCLEEERREVLESVAERLSAAMEDADAMAACSYLLRHLAASGYGCHQVSIEPRYRE